MHFCGRLSLFYYVSQSRSQSFVPLDQRVPRALVFRPLVKGNEALGTRWYVSLQNVLWRYRILKEKKQYRF